MICFLPIFGFYMKNYPQLAISVPPLFLTIGTRQKWKLIITTEIWLSIYNDIATVGWNLTNKSAKIRNHIVGLNLTKINAFKNFSNGAECKHKIIWGAMKFCLILSLIMKLFVQIYYCTIFPFLSLNLNTVVFFAAHCTVSYGLLGIWNSNFGKNWWFMIS